MLSTLLQYQMVSQNLDRSLEIIASDPTVERESEYYLENIGNVTSIDEFLDDDRLFKYAMKAFGLEDMDYAKAFMRKALEEGITDDDAFANQLSDNRYKEFVEAFDFVTYGETATSLSAAQEDVVAAYKQQTLEESEGDSNEGVRLALYFTRKVGEVDSGLALIADKALAEVVYTMLGLPDEFAMSDVDKQAAYLEENIDIEQLTDPEYVDKLVQRFSVMYDMENGTQETANVTTLFSSITGSTSSIVEIDQDTLLSIQNLQLGGS